MIKIRKDDADTLDFAACQTAGNDSGVIGVIDDVPWKEMLRMVKGPESSESLDYFRQAERKILSKLL